MIQSSDPDNELRTPPWSRRGTAVVEQPSWNG